MAASGQISAGSLVLSINGNDEGFQRTADRVTAKLSSFSDRYFKFSTSLAATSAAISSLVVAPLKSMISSFSELGAGLDKITKKLRVSVAEMGQLGFAAEQTGASQADVQAAFGALADKMQRARLGDFGARQEILRGSGLRYEDLAGKDAKEQFLAIVDVIEKTQNYADKAEIAKRMFGSDALLPLLAKGRAGIQDLMAEADKLGAPWNDQMVENSRKLAASFARIQTVIVGMRDAFLSDMTDTITKWLEKAQAALLVAKDFVDRHQQLAKVLAIAAAAVTSLAVGGGMLSLTARLMAPLFTGIFSVLSSLVPLAAGFVGALASWPVLLAAAGAALLTMTETGRGLLASVWDGLRGLYDIVAGTVSKVLDAIKWFLGDAIALLLAGDISGAWASIWHHVQLVTYTALDWLQRQFGVFYDIGAAAFGTIYEYATGAWASMWDGISKGTAAAVKWLGGAFQAAYKAVAKFCGDAAEGYGALADQIGADTSSIGELLVTAWYGMEQSILGVWYSLKSGWYSVVAYFRTVWADFASWWGKTCNWILGKLQGMTDQEIASLNKQVEAAHEATKREIEADKAAAKSNNEEEKKAALDGLRRGTKAFLQRSHEARDARSESMNAKKLELEALILEDRRKLQKQDIAKPELVEAAKNLANPNAAAPVFLQQAREMGSSVASSSWQAAFGLGSSTADKQLDATLRILRFLEGNVGPIDGQGAMI